jgi:hypothetical protein
MDKTYIYTEFSGMRAMVRTALEKPEEKRTVPGAAALIRALRRLDARNRVTFLSGSPKQMQSVLRAKLRLDGIEPDEFILKPNLENLLRGRFRALTEQVGYKLPALLDARRRTPPEMSEVCFGDDAESDALIYSLYADVLAGRVTTAVLTRVLTNTGVYDDDAAHTVGLACALEAGDVVRRIFIHLEGKVAPARFGRFGARVVPIHNYFQAALVLHQDGVLPMAGLTEVLASLERDHGYDSFRVANSVQDARRRGIVSGETTAALAAALRAGAPVADGETLAHEFERRLAALAERPADPPPPAAGTIDYLHALEELSAGKRE